MDPNESDAAHNALVEPQQHEMPPVPGTAAVAAALAVEPDETQADEFKARGNTLYAGSDYIGAIECYSHAIDLCPDAAPQKRSVYHSNRAACHCALVQWNSAIADCTAAIEFDAANLKAVLRRSTAYEKQTDFTAALADQRRALELAPSDRAISANIARLEKLEHAKLEQQKAEMMGKLKELGNGLLGKFGLSLDNFRATQDPATGGYSVQFNQR